MMPSRVRICIVFIGSFAVVVASIVKHRIGHAAASAGRAALPFHFPARACRFRRFGRRGVFNHNHLRPPPMDIFSPTTGGTLTARTAARARPRRNDPLARGFAAFAEKPFSFIFAPHLHADLEIKSIRACCFTRSGKR